MQYDYEQVANQKNFMLLFILRLVTINIYAVFFLFAYFILNIFIPIRNLFAELTFVIALQYFAYMRIRKGNIKTIETFLFLVFDTVFLVFVMLQTGGPSNPFLGLLIIPIILGSILLPRNLAWAIYGIAILGFLSIEFIESPFVVGKSRHSAFFELHAQGMMLSFAISSLLLLYFVTRAMQNLRERDRAIHELRQNALEQQNILRLGLLSAGAAHELGGPLSTLSIILNDWKVLGSPAKKEERNQEINTMLQQIEQSKNILTRILASSGNMRGQGAKFEDFGQFLTQICDDWQNNSANNINLSYDIRIENFNAACDLIIEQAIITILNNAKDASSENNQDKILLNAYINDDNIVIDIEDFGIGAPQDLLNKIRQENYTTKEEHGFGVGLFLAQGTMHALGGNLEMENKENMGLIVKMSFPKKAIAI